MEYWNDGMMGTNNNRCGTILLTCLDHSDLWSFEFVSSFGFRASDLVAATPHYDFCGSVVKGGLLNGNDENDPVKDERPK